MMFDVVDMVTDKALDFPCLKEFLISVLRSTHVCLTQVIVYTFHPDGYTDDQKAKHDEAYDGIDNMFKIAKKIGFDKISFGSDIITSPEMLKRVPEDLYENENPSC